MNGLRLILNDGTVIEGGRAGYAEGFLWCYFTGYTMAQTALTFLDPEKTSRIVFQYGEMEDEYIGFTNCTLMRTDADGLVSVCLTKSGR